MINQILQGMVSVLEPITKLKNSTEIYYNKGLQLQEILIALSICSVTNPIIKKALTNIKKLEGCEAHSTYIVQDGELKSLKGLKINLTCESDYYYNNYYN